LNLVWGTILIPGNPRAATGSGIGRGISAYSLVPCAGASGAAVREAPPPSGRPPAKHLPADRGVVGRNRGRRPPAGSFGGRQVGPPTARPRSSGRCGERQTRSFLTVTTAPMPPTTVAFACIGQTLRRVDSEATCLGCTRPPHTRLLRIMGRGPDPYNPNSCSSASRARSSSSSC
jgi:hypothetical protein